VFRKDNMMNRRLFLGDICGGLLGGSLFGNRLFSAKLFDNKINSSKSIRDYLDNPELNKKMLRKITGKIPQTNPITKNVFIDTIDKERVVPIGKIGILGYYEAPLEDGGTISIPIIRYKSKIEMPNYIRINRFDVLEKFLDSLVENICKSIYKDRQECIDYAIKDSDINIPISYNYKTSCYHINNDLVLECNAGFLVSSIEIKN